MAWRLLGDKPSSEPMLTDISGTRVRWVKSVTFVPVITFFNFCRCFKIYWATTIKLQICWHRWTTLSSDEAIVCVCPIICDTWSNEVTLCRIVLYLGTNQIVWSPGPLLYWIFGNSVPHRALCHTVQSYDGFDWSGNHVCASQDHASRCESLECFNGISKPKSTMWYRIPSVHNFSDILSWIMCGVDRKL